MKQYRIGDFAKYLGVTPDLLKHYEEVGILQPQRSESGYRFYPFNATSILIESIRLRNYGLTLREIGEILVNHSVDNAGMERLFEQNLERLRQEIQLDEALLREHEAFLRWKEVLEERDWDWEIRRSEPMLFLPHTNRDDFLQDPRIYEILNDWMSFIPLVKSSMRVDESGGLTWGFTVPARDAERLNLPLNDAVERIPARKIFYYKYKAQEPRFYQEDRELPGYPAFQTLRALGLVNEGSYYRTAMMPADWQQALRYHYGYYAIPLAEQ